MVQAQLEPIQPHMVQAQTKSIPIFWTPSPLGPSGNPLPLFVKVVKSPKFYFYRNPDFETDVQECCWWRWNYTYGPQVTAAITAHWGQQYASDEHHMWRTPRTWRRQRMVKWQLRLDLTENTRCIWLPLPFRHGIIYTFNYTLIIPPMHLSTVGVHTFGGHRLDVEKGRQILSSFHYRCQYSNDISRLLFTRCYNT